MIWKIQTEGTGRRTQEEGLGLAEARMVKSPSLRVPGLRELPPDRVPVLCYMQEAAC